MKVYKYVGNATLVNVPGRDVTEIEAIESGLDTALMIASGLYQLVEEIQQTSQPEQQQSGEQQPIQQPSPNGEW